MRLKSQIYEKKSKSNIFFMYMISVDAYDNMVKTEKIRKEQCLVWGSLPTSFSGFVGPCSVKFCHCFFELFIP